MTLAAAKKKSKKSARPRLIPDGILQLGLGFWGSRTFGLSNFTTLQWFTYVNHITQTLAPDHLGANSRPRLSRFDDHPLG